MADSVIIGDYEYSIKDSSRRTASVQVVDRSLSSYGAIQPSVMIDGVEYNVIFMAYCFFDCSRLTTPPSIPDGVQGMTGCFQNCESLAVAPIIPDTVRFMMDCFAGCASLTTAPEIPSSVRDMQGCFAYCTSLKGNIFVNNQAHGDDMFYATSNLITIRPRNLDIISSWQEIANQYNNVSVALDSYIGYTFLSSRKLTKAENLNYNTTRGVRIDILLDCTDTFTLLNIVPASGKLYTIDDTQITFPYSPPSLLRCYFIYESSSQVPTGKLTIEVRNINTTFNSLQVYLPSTATISQFEQKESDTTKQLAPQINKLTSLIFNPQSNNVTNVKTLVSYIYQSAIGNPLLNIINNDNKTQINTLKSDNTLDIKHFVTTADNIQVTTDKTLQDIITECYNALET